MKNIILAIAVLFLTSACNVGFEKPSLNHDWGVVPLGQSYEKAAQKHISYTLKDPYSAEYRFGTPYQAYDNWGLIHGGKIGWAGWLLPVYVNGKNSYGAYTGFTPFVVLFTNGQPVRSMTEKMWKTHIISRY